MSERGRLRPEELVREVEAGRIDTVVTAIPDLYGRLVGKRIHAPFFLESIAGHGMHVCDYLLACDMEMDPTPGYAFTNWAAGYGDLRAVPDLGTLRVAAWLDRTAVVLCDCVDDRSGDLIPVAPRSMLRRQLERLRAAGFTAKMASELEFFLFRDTYGEARAKHYQALRTAGDYIEDYHVLSGTYAEPVVGSIRRLIDASGIPVEFSKGEWGPGQHEINLRYAEALEMADRHVLYKTAAKEIAAAHGHSLTFMAKWNASFAGSSLHVHMSLWNDRDQPVFAPAGDPSPTFRHFIGGLLAHARELAWCFAPTVNSYKRYREGTFAPTRITWSVDNRTAGFRVVGHGPALRVECRIPGADANPYVVYAALLAAGLDGIAHKRDPGAPFSGDAYVAGELPRVPHSMTESIAELERSVFAREAFGDAVVDHLLHFARTELAAHEIAVTDHERARYFERI
ncbi:MAG: glutamine synthetase [Proteobacteria bacterium]|nr:MAG: glutamine synthetase [Pseudomonadota bacterium]